MLSLCLQSCFPPPPLFILSFLSLLLISQCNQIEEFTKKAVELEVERRSTNQSATGLKVSEGSELLCEHKGALAFAHRLCVKCYEEVIPAAYF